MTPPVTVNVLDWVKMENDIKPWLEMAKNSFNERGIGSDWARALDEAHKILSFPSTPPGVSHLTMVATVEIRLAPTVGEIEVSLSMFHDRSSHILTRPGLHHQA